MSDRYRLTHRLPREAYERLVAEDLEWLDAQPPCLEREHIATIVRASVDMLYPIPTWKTDRCVECGITGIKLWRLDLPPRLGRLHCAACVEKTVGGAPDPESAYRFREYEPALRNDSGGRWYAHAEVAPKDVVARWQALPLRAGSTATGYTSRGFGEYGVVVDSHGNTITARQSSAMGGPYVWLFTRNAEGHDHAVGATEHVVAATPHLTVGQAVELVAALQRFIDDEPAAARRAP